jgi:hypothetical protein
MNDDLKKNKLVRKSKKYYLGLDGYKKENCANSVLYAFKDVIDPCIDIGVCDNFSGGRAPQGVCGAFYTAKTILESSNNKDKINELEKSFIDKAGSLKCKEIRANNKLSCLGCVENSSEFLSDCL